MASEYCRMGYSEMPIPSQIRAVDGARAEPGAVDPSSRAKYIHRKVYIHKLSESTISGVWRLYSRSAYPF